MVLCRLGLPWVEPAALSAARWCGLQHRRVGGCRCWTATLEALRRGAVQYSDCKQHKPPAAARTCPQVLEHEREAEAQAAKKLPDFRAGDVLELKLVRAAARLGRGKGGDGLGHISAVVGRPRLAAEPAGLELTCPFQLLPRVAAEVAILGCCACAAFHLGTFCYCPSACELARRLKPPSPPTHPQCPCQSVPENKRRVTTFKGVVIARSNRGYRSTFTLRNMIGTSGGIERTFPL